jgi:hypothetical protein
MPIINRTFTYRGSIKVSSSDLALARAGRKICTIRLGILQVAANLLDLTDGKGRLRVKIVEVDNRRKYGELTDEDAKMDGLNSIDELDADLRKFYGRIDPKQPMTIIHFRPVDDSQNTAFG